MDGDRWETSREGELDPELTEEAGYAEWDPPGRDWMPFLLRLVSIVLLVALVGTSLSGALLFFLA